MKKLLNGSINPESPFLKMGFALLLFAVIILSGCAAQKIAEKPPEKPEYQEVLKKWTRGKKIYEGLEARLYITATYKDPEFRKAYIARFVNSYELEESLKDALLVREMDQADRYNEFFFTAYTPDQKWNDFERPDSIWKLYLEDDTGARLKPISVTKVDASDPLIREFFPYSDLWSSGYLVKFPKYSEAGAEPIPSGETIYLRLIVTGVLGKGELEWLLRE